MKMSGKIENILTKYEEDINHHDCQQWDRPIFEDAAFNSIKETNKRKTRRKIELLDVDLVRGSTFPKSKTEHDFKSILLFSLMSVIFFPLRANWWIKKTSFSCYFIGCMIFCSSLINLFIFQQVFFNQSDWIQFHEVYEPILLFIVIAFLQCQIVSPLKLKNLEFYDQQVKTRRSSSRKTRKITPKRRLSVGVRHCMHHSNNIDSWHENSSSGSDHDHRAIDDTNTASDCQQVNNHLRCNHETQSSLEEKDSDHDREAAQAENLRSRKSSQTKFLATEDLQTSGGEDKESSPIVLKIGTTLWDGDEAPTKVYLSALQIGNMVHCRSRDIPDSVQYAVIGIICSITIAILPLTFKQDQLQESLSLLATSDFLSNILRDTVLNYESNHSRICVDDKVGYESLFSLIIILTSTLTRFTLTLTLFGMLSVAERAWKRRYFTAKLFSHITSTRKSMKFKIPHFRLYKVRNIKAWLCIRAFLRKREALRSIDCIVNTAFVLALGNVSWLCYQLLKDDDANPEMNPTNCLVITWSISIGFYILRYMTLANKINKKYRNLSVLLTEQINLYLQMEMKPHKKEQLANANNVLKLSNDLLKEIPTEAVPSYLASSPFLYNFFKVLLLSAVSGVLSEMLGFKLKLYKVKLK